ncbi:hypothetical protein L6258_00820 [Candidatus Parcubacteria bacterium]|nr:hypothetical protein [Candidatus Parcubacteria bacterium]
MALVVVDKTLSQKDLDRALREFNMIRQPTPLDVATDLKRCVHASLSEKGFESQNFKTFLNHGLTTLNQRQRLGSWRPLP